MATATDDFNRANESPLAGVWTNFRTASNRMFLVSNAVTWELSGQGDAGVFHSTNFTTNHFSEAAITVNSTVGGGQGPGVHVRNNGGLEAASSRYRLVADHAASNNVELSKFIAGAYTLLADYTQSFADGAKIRLEADGTSLTSILAGVTLGTVTDASLTTQTKVGLAYSSSVISYSIDDWSGGDLAVAPQGFIGGRGHSTVRLRRGPIGAPRTMRSPRLYLGVDTPAVTLVQADDSGVGTDTASLTAALSGADTGVGVDTPTLVAALPSQGDTGSGADAASLVAFPTAADGGTGADGSALIVAASGQDTGTGLDSTALAAALSAADTALGNDSFSVVVPGTPSFADAGVGTDAFSVVAKVTGADTGSGADTTTVQFSTTVTDAGVGADQMLLHASPLSTDTGIGTDAVLPLRAFLPAAEAGSAADGAAATYPPFVTADAALGIDAFSVITGTILPFIVTGSIGGPTGGGTIPRPGTGSIAGARSGDVAEGVLL